MDAYQVEINDQMVTIPKDKWTMVVGPVGSGKSKLFHRITSSSFKKKFFPQDKIILLSSHSFFPQDKIKKELLMNIEDQKAIETILKIFGISSISTLIRLEPSVGMNQVLNFLYAYIKHPAIWILDQTFSMIDPIHRKKLLSWFKKETKKNHQTVLYTSSDPEDILQADQVIVYKEKILFMGPKRKFYEEEKLIHSLGLEYPFDVELYHQLKYYNVFDKPIYDQERMIDYLWK